MTEQERFHFDYVCGDTGLIDEQAEHQWFIGNCCSITDLKKNWKTVCDKLNEVNEENEILKEENEQLKQENKKILDTINNKITEKGMNWYKAEDNSKEEKDANLQLKVLEEVRDELKEIVKRKDGG